MNASKMITQHAPHSRVWGPSLADEMLIANLSDEAKGAIKRVFGDGPTGFKYTVKDLEQAYDAGFEDAAEGSYVEFSGSNFASYMKET